MFGVASEKTQNKGGEGGGRKKNKQSSSIYKVPAQIKKKIKNPLAASRKSGAKQLSIHRCHIFFNYKKKSVDLCYCYHQQCVY
jgi:hypothetical protein